METKFKFLDLTHAYGFNNTYNIANCRVGVAAINQKS
jgi:hypothetical protein